MAQGLRRPAGRPGNKIVSADEVSPVQYSDDRYHLNVEINTKDCNVPRDELTRMQQELSRVGKAVQDFAASDLILNLIHHAGSGTYHVEAELKLPGKTLFADNRDAYLDCAFQSCLRGLTARVEAYKRRPDERAEQIAERETALEQDIVAPEQPDMGPLGEAALAGDYAAFRSALSGYEEWLRKRVGRWLQRYPEAEAQLHKRFRLGDFVEEVYLNAFENYARRPTDVPFHDWLDSLLDPSLKALLRHPDEERENASFARTVRELPAGQ
jgi:ribosome-associated translation inhibitor RaiA